MPDQPVIFINYRRHDGLDGARHLHEYLSRRFGGERIFFDLSTIESGNIFPENLRRGVEECAALLALIGPEWLDVSDTEGRRRLDDPSDFVRQEIALALEHGKTVIPVLFGDTPAPPDIRLPEPLKPLAARDALTLRGKTFEYNTQRRELVRLLAKVPGIPDPFPEANEPLVGVSAKELSAIIDAATRGIRQLSDAQRETIEALKAQVGANEAQIQAFFKLIGEAEVPPEKQLTRLVEIASEVREVRAQVGARPEDEPEIRCLKDGVRAALDAGRLQVADDLLSKMETAQDGFLQRHQREIERRQLDRAATTAKRAGVALTRLRYREAAKHFATAAKTVPPEYKDQALEYLHGEAAALYVQGEVFGDNGALVEAVSRYQTLLTLTSRERAPFDWATLQSDLGTVLQVIGEREVGTKHLKQAVTAFDSALESHTRDQDPLGLAGIQNNLGNALSILGGREAGIECLERAIDVFKAVLEVRTREVAPLEWAITQTSLGSALGILGERGLGTERLEAAVAAFRNALEVLVDVRDRDPLQWAIAQINLGNALRTLGEREFGIDRASGINRLVDALAACNATLNVATREVHPIMWAMTQHNMGYTLWKLGVFELDPESGTRHLENALDACTAALEVRSRKRLPLAWAQTKQILGSVLVALGEHKTGTRYLKKAVATFNAVLEICTRTGHPLAWAMTQNSLGYALWVLGKRKRETACLREAVDAFQATLQVYTREGLLRDWATTQINLGNALWTLGEREKNAATLKNAQLSITAGFEVFMNEGQKQLRGYFEGRLSELDKQIAIMTRHP